MTTSRPGALYAVTLRAHARGVRASDLPEDDPDLLWERVTSVLVAHVTQPEAEVIGFCNRADVDHVLLILAELEGVGA